METHKHIGVITPANLDLGRDVLRGVRQYCNQHPGMKLDLISDSGYHPGIGEGTGPLDCIVAQVHEPEALKHLKKICPNLVVTSNRNPVSNAVRVLNDDVAVGRMGAEHLLSLGHRTLAFMGAGGFAFSHERERGFIEACGTAGCSAHLFEGSSQSQFPVVLEELLALPGPVGLMAVSDMHARWLIEAMNDPASLVPNRIAILGVDNDSLQNALSPIGISSVRLSGERLGYEAAAQGMRLASGSSVPKEPIRIAPRDIVSRRSTDSLAVTDRLAVRVMRLVRERMAELKDAGDLVKAMDIPRRTLEVNFRRATGQTLAHELAHARIQRARELLSTTDLSIKEIAFLVGFSEPRMLTLVFKRMTGEKPSEYRARVRPGE